MAAPIFAALVLGCGSSGRPEDPDRKVTPWTAQFEINSYQPVQSLAVAADGTMVFTGGFSDTANFGGGTLTSVGQRDAFITMLGDTGWPLWSGRAANPADEWGQAVAVAPNGDVILAGNFTGELEFGSKHLDASSSPSVFLVRFNTWGDVLWAKTLGDKEGWLYVNSLAVTPGGDAVIGGRFYQQTTLGAHTYKTTGYEAYVAELDENGDHVFSEAFGGSNQNLTSLAVTKDGSIVVAGSHIGEIQLGKTSFTTYFDAFFAAKLQKDGSPEWLVQGETDSYVGSCSVGVDAGGDVFVSGTYGGNMSFGDVKLTSASYNDAFVAKLSSGGKPLWLKSFGTPLNNAEVRASVVDAAGHVIIAGPYSGPLDFGGGALPASTQAGFLAELDGDGNHVASQAFDSVESDGVSSIDVLALDPAGGLVAGGWFTDHLHVPDNVLASDDGRNVFFVRLPH